MENNEKKENIGQLAEIAKPLLAWYHVHRRILPWREDPTPYKVWVSEIMLQQTRVEAVKPYFARFMENLPDVKALAEAEEETLLKLWEGLGYYNRVRNLQKAAIQIQTEYGGEMPGEYEELLKLTGIGSYTAGAISSIAFGKKKPAVDGNVLRVLSRIRMDDRLITDAKVKALVEEELLEAMSAEEPGNFNQAMMEIGACVCIPNGAPLCDACPLAHLCMAKAANAQQDYPKKESKKPRTIENRTILVMQDASRVAIHKRSEKGLLAGLYEFPAMEGHFTAEEVTSFLKDKGIRILRIQRLEDVKHIFTHKEWHMIGYRIRVDELADRTEGEDWIYIEPAETRDRYPIPSAFQAYAAQMEMKRGKETFTL